MSIEISKTHPSFVTLLSSRDHRSGILMQIGIPIEAQEPGIARAHYMKSTAQNARPGLQIVG